MIPLGSVEKYNANGFWRIVDAYPEKNEYRIGRLCCFPFELEVNTPAYWVYMKESNGQDYAGGYVRTSKVQTIQYNGVDQIQLSTMNSQYVFERVL